jgi:hypothetical protein
LRREFPLDSKMPFEPRRRRRRNHRPEQCTTRNLPPDLRLLRITADALALAEPHLHPAARSASRIRRAVGASCDA